MSLSTLGENGRFIEMKNAGYGNSMKAGIGEVISMLD
jgi:hypothetical protein